MNKMYLLLYGVLFILGSFTTSHAQSFKTGDVVYFRTLQCTEKYHFLSPVYIIATVDKVIGSKAILSTDMYLYKCDRDDSYWQIGTVLNISKRYGMGFLYDTWRASQNKGYTWQVKDLKHYDEKAEKALTGGKISSSSKNCSVIAGS